MKPSTILSSAAVLAAVLLGNGVDARKNIGAQAGLPAGGMQVPAYAPPSPPMGQQYAPPAPPMNQAPAYAPPSPPMNKPPAYAPPSPPMNQQPPMNNPPVYAPTAVVTVAPQTLYTGKFITMTCPQNQPGYTISAPPLCTTVAGTGMMQNKPYMQNTPGVYGAPGPTPMYSGKFITMTCPQNHPGYTLSAPPLCTTVAVAPVANCPPPSTTTATTTITVDVTTTSQLTVTTTAISKIIKMRKCTRIGGGRTPLFTPTPTPVITSGVANVVTCPPATTTKITSTTTKTEDVVITSIITVTAPQTQTITQTVDAPCETIVVCPEIAPTTTTSFITKTIDMTQTATVTATATQTSIVKQMRKCTQKRAGGTPTPTPGVYNNNSNGGVAAVTQSPKLYTGKFITMTCPQNAPAYTISAPPLCTQAAKAGVKAAQNANPAPAVIPAGAPAAAPTYAVYRPMMGGAKKDALVADDNDDDDDDEDDEE